MRKIEQKRIICAGGGPASISLAIELIEMGISGDDIVIFEKGEAPIKAIRQFYPDKKMTLANYKNLPTETHGHIACFPDLTKAETLTYFDELIAKYQLNYQLNSEVSKVTLEADQSLRVFVNQDQYEAQFVGVGIGILGRPNKPKYKLPLKLRDHLLFDLTSQVVKDKKVLVVGGGDTSSEYCQILCEENPEVTLSVRSDHLDRMMEVNQKAALRLEKEGRLRILMSTEISEIQEESEKPKVIFSTHAPEVFDKVIYAIGGSTPVNFLKTIGVEFDSSNWPKTDEAGATNVKNLYLLGDLVAGKTGGSIITAYNASFRAAQQIVASL
jgi:thioredoxin reductase (NADPH)